MAYEDPQTVKGFHYLTQPKEVLFLSKTQVAYEKGITYKSFVGRKRLLLLLLFIAVVVAAFISINAGASSLSIGQILKALFGVGDSKANMVIRGIRLPRVVAGLVAGVGLAVSGCIMQNNLRNPLAAPSTLGIANAAAFGANVAIILFGAGSVLSTGVGEVAISNPYIVTTTALFFSLIATAVILSLSKLRRFSPESIILAGIAISSLFSAGTMIIQYFAEDTTKVAAVIFWTFGELGRASWNEILIMGVCVVAALIYFTARRWDYNALDGGEETAKSLGVNIEHVRLGGMFVSSVITAVCVSFLGIIGFIGLVAPQMTKRIIGNDKRFLIPASAIMGALILLLSDTLARVLLSPQTLPVGAVTSFLGAPVFLYLLIKGDSSR